jgi:triosephosphate isomerase (TIM)
MRKPFVAGNWKMFKTVAEARHLVSELVPGLQAVGSVEKVLCPPATSLLAVAALLEGTEIGLGAQNMHWELSGAYTGEISPSMVAELCRFVIIGHSERRTYFGETDETVNRKVTAALAQGITPIVCVGETLDEYEANRTAEVVGRQVRQGLAGLNASVEQMGANALVIAYEPVWAIGTGRASSPDGAAKVLREIIRPALAEMFGSSVAQGVRILYGGSVNAKNAAEFFAESEIDGALVGGASLKAPDFTQIVQAAAR